ncbi:EAL and modified HD-GYP domain-containing signal transduction protein [Oxalobacteraceae bacterium GrIS 2.11]
MSQDTSFDQDNALDFYIARQPILDRHQKLSCYELLFRRESDESANVINDIAATATVIAHASELGLTNVIGTVPGLINVDAKVLMSDFFRFLPHDKVFLEILETVEVTDTLIERLTHLKAEGYHFVVDDVVADSAGLRRVLPFIDMIKIDIMELTRAELSALFKLLKGCNKKMLAEKVERLDDFAFCHELGFDLFQGYFFAKPKILSGKKLHSSQLTVVNILNMLVGDAETAEIEKAIKKDASLGLSLIKLANTPAFMTTQRIATLKQAITILGRRQLQRWLQILMYAESGKPDSLMSPLLNLATTRGKLMELMAQKIMPRDQLAADIAFTAGIMSLLDVIFGAPMPLLLAQISVADEIKEALIGRSGVFGGMLQLVIDLENMANRGSVMTASLQNFQLRIEELRAMQLQAFRFSDSIAH